MDLQVRFAPRVIFCYLLELFLIKPFLGEIGITVFVGSAMAATAVMGVISEVIRQRFVIARPASH